MTMLLFFIGLPFVIYFLVDYFVASRFRNRMPSFLIDAEKIQSDSFIQKIVDKIEAWLEEREKGKTLSHWYKKLGFGREFSLGHFIITNIFLFIAGFNFHLIVNTNLILTYAIFVFFEAIIIFAVSKKKLDAKKVDTVLPGMFSTIAASYEAYPDLANSLREAEFSSNDKRAKNILKRVNNMVKTGKTPGEALRLVSKEVGSPAFSFACVSIVSQTRSGADIGKFLSFTANQLVHQNLTKKEIDQILFQNKVSAVLSIVIAPLMFLISAATSENYRDVVFGLPSGRALLTFAFLWWLIGVFVTYKSINYQI